MYYIIIILNSTVQSNDLYWAHKAGDCSDRYGF